MRLVIASLLVLALCYVHLTLAAININAGRRYFIGGEFTVVNGTNANNIVAFDGKKYITMGTGTNGPVKVVHIDIFKNVYIGGSFTTAGGVSTGPIAVWRFDKSNWERVGNLTSSHFANNAVVNAIETDCMNLVKNLNFPCDVFIGGNFKLTVPAGEATNIAKYDYSSTSWDVLSGHGMDSTATVHALVKKELGLPTEKALKKLWVGGDLGGGVYLKMYATDSKKWNNIAGPNNVVYDFYYDPNVFSTDVIYVTGAFDFTCSSSRCTYLASLNHKSTAFTAVGNSTALMVAGGAIRRIDVIRDGDIYVSGTVQDNLKYMKKGQNDFLKVSSNQPKTNPVLALDVCGETDLGCKAGSVVIGSYNGLKFYNEGDGTWTGQEEYFTGAAFTVNSIQSTLYVSSASMTGISFLLILVAILSLIFF
ncbi:hypothetical protein ABK040_002286 [Willaertia magna]